MSIHLSLFLLLYILIVLFFLIFFFVQLYHIYRFSFWSRLGMIATSTYIILFFLTIGISFYFLGKVDWSSDLLTIQLGPTSQQQ